MKLFSEFIFFENNGVEITQYCFVRQASLRCVIGYTCGYEMQSSWVIFRKIEFEKTLCHPSEWRFFNIVFRTCEFESHWRRQRTPESQMRTRWDASRIRDDWTVCLSSLRGCMYQSVELHGIYCYTRQVEQMSRGKIRSDKIGQATEEYSLS